jgi:hypothetical protein|tara:strand:- start:224 stop:505 length:282 start_codon:yes stop_codon:yes gene_type:complete
MDCSPKPVAVNRLLLRIPGGFSFLFVLDSLIDLLTVNGNLLGRADADTNLVTLNAEDSHCDVIPDHKRLTDPTRQNKHVGISLIFLFLEERHI